MYYIYLKVGVSQTRAPLIETFHCFIFHLWFFLFFGILAVYLCMHVIALLQLRYIIVVTILYKNISIYF